jgi:uncharacterized protein YoxC
MNDPSDRPGRRRIPTLGQLVSDGVGDVAGFLRVLPEIAVSLRAIRKHTEHMDAEVTGMHAAVERLDDEVVELRAQIAELDGRMATVADAVTRLEPHIQDVNLAVRPLRRARARMAGRLIAEAPREEAAGEPS